MPVDFLTNKQKETYRKFPHDIESEILHKYFHLDDYDKSLIKICRREHNKLAQLAGTRENGKATFKSQSNQDL